MIQTILVHSNIFCIILLSRAGLNGETRFFFSVVKSVQTSWGKCWREYIHQPITAFFRNIEKAINDGKCGNSIKTHCESIFVFTKSGLWHNPPNIDKTVRVEIYDFFFLHGFSCFSTREINNYFRTKLNTYVNLFQRHLQSKRTKG